MIRAILVCLIIAGLYYYFLYARIGVPLTLHAFKDVSPEHFDRILAALKRFEEERLGRGDIHALSAHRATVTKHLYEIKFRLPNDIERRAALQKIIDEMERDLEDDIQFLRKTRQRPLEFPYPLENYFMDLEPVVLKQDRGQSPAYSSSFSQVWGA